MSLDLDYGASLGTDRLRRAVAEATGSPSWEGVIITNGAVEALLIACAAALGTRTRVAVAVPTYEGLIRAAQAAGATVETIPVWVPEASALDFSGFVPSLLSRCAAVIVNTPHNPTGLVADRSELVDLARRCHRSGTLLIVDEVSSGTLDPAAASVASEEVFREAPVVVVGDVSKSLGLGGLRIGWLATAWPATLSRAIELRDLTSLGNSAPSQHLAALALEGRSRLSVSDLARRNLQALERWIESTPGAGMPVPADGLVAFPRLPLPDGSLTFAERLRSDAQVSVAPGRLFGHDNRLRLGLGASADHFVEGLARLAESMRSPRR